MLASLPSNLRTRLHFVFADFADCDLAGLVREGVAAVTAERRKRAAEGGGGGGAPDPPPTPPSPTPPPPPPTSVVVYVNNLAFPPGVNGRHGRQLAAVASELSSSGGEGVFEGAGAGVSVTVVSAVPLAALEAGSGGGENASVARLTLGMSFNPAHDARVYAAIGP